MMLPVVLIGDTSDHGGRVVSGRDGFTVDGMPIACVGDLFDCPIHGVNPIVEGSANDTEDGRPIAYAGARTACGASLVAWCRTYFFTIDGNTGASTASVRWASDAGYTGYDEHFEFQDQDSGRPVPEVAYEFSTRNRTHQGRSDDKGWSDHAFGSSAEEVSLTHAVQTRVGIRE